MKGRYNGCHMTIYGTILPGAASIARSSFLADQLTERARYKIKVLDWYRGHGQDTSLTARHFGIGRMTLYRWFKRFKQSGIIGFNEYSRKPKNVRKPVIQGDILMRIIQLRKQYPAWSKYKIRTLLARENIHVSASTIGRTIKRRGLINRKISKKRRKAALSPRARFPKGLSISSEGDMVQIDTKYIMLTGGKKYYQFTAIDVLSKRRILRVYASEFSRNGKAFLEERIKNFPFPIKTVQTDNGSPFLKEFDNLCKKLDISHYFIYPRTPKQNTYVEISHQADKKEFYQQGNVCSALSVMQERIKAWEYIWNNIRPHQALNYLTPQEYSNRLKVVKLPTKHFITLQT
ncbi:DDE domain-containing protein [bacterium]|nr:MAG: DDE domain-containing protein [bacterium]